jgi:hypothetical protein
MITKKYVHGNPSSMHSNIYQPALTVLLITGDKVRLVVAIGKEILPQWEQQEQEPL